MENISRMLTKKSKNQLRREKLKLKKELEQGKRIGNDVKTDNIEDKKNDKTNKKNEPIISEIIVQDNLSDSLSGTLATIYKNVFDKFQITNNLEEEKTGITDDNNENTQKGELITRESTEEQEEAELDNNSLNELNDPKKISKRQLKKLYKIPLSILKSESENPESIDWIDADSSDPRLLIYLKTLHNAVPIPRHWNSKKGFLASKKGIERLPFQLPKFILDTGILEMRNTDVETDDNLKQRMRERVQPKSGQLDIDFNKLHDAFFKYQSKPNLLKFGEVYYEGMENSDQLTNLKISRIKPGSMSSELKKALGMLDDSKNNNLPPWYERMQILGPPPSYPNMKINARGKVIFTDGNEVNLGEPIVKTLFGKFKEEESESESESESEEEDEKEDEDENKVDQFNAEKGDVLLDSIGEDDQPTLEKDKKDENEEVENDKQKTLYTVLKDKESGDKTSIYGSSTLAYDMTSDNKKRTETEQHESSKAKRQKSENNFEKFRF